MDYSTFMARVQEILHLESPEDAETAVEATLTTLGERLSTPQRTQLAAQLPNQMKRMLFRRQRTRRFPLEVFYKRVSSRADVGYRVGVRRSRAVMAVLQEAISPGLREKLLKHLPTEYDELLSETPANQRSESG